jgi:hypothetical protein
MAEIHSTATIRAQVLKDTGFEGDDFAGTSTEVNDRILRSVRELHWEVIKCLGERVYRKVHAFSALAGTTSYTLPADLCQSLKRAAMATR